MTHRPLPPTGGGSPIISASARATAKQGLPAPFTLTLSTSPEAAARGLDVVERIRAACTSDDIETVSIFAVLFPAVLARVPEFHALMDELDRMQDAATIKKIFHVPGGRGRPRVDKFEFVALIEHVMETEDLKTVTAALDLIANHLAAERERERRGERGTDEPAIPKPPSPKTLQNSHRLAPLFRLWSGSLYVAESLLTASPWVPPGFTPERPQLVATRLSNSIVLHSPNDSITEIKKKH